MLQVAASRNRAGTTEPRREEVAAGMPPAGRARRRSGVVNVAVLVGVPVGVCEGERQTALVSRDGPCDLGLRPSSLSPQSL
ncbi:MAG: hypothetical protein ABSA52_07360 [Candidatus Binatia bacterium]